MLNCPEIWALHNRWKPFGQGTNIFVKGYDQAIEETSEKNKDGQGRPLRGEIIEELNLLDSLNPKDERAGIPMILLLPETIKPASNSQTSLASYLQSSTQAAERQLISLVDERQWFLPSLPFLFHRRL